MHACNATTTGGPVKHPNNFFAYNLRAVWEIWTALNPMKKIKRHACLLVVMLGATTTTTKEKSHKRSVAVSLSPIHTSQPVLQT
jgi:hypothetical protein